MAVGVDVEMSELKRGMVGSSVDDSPAQERLSLGFSMLFTALAAPTRCSSFVAQVIVLSDPRAGAIHAGSELTVLCHAAQVQCAVEELLSRTDRRTGQLLCGSLLHSH